MRDNRRHAGAAADHHREAESPAAAPVLHGRPQEQVGGQLSHARQEEVEVGVAAQRRGVVGQADVDGRVREPAVEEQGQRDRPRIRRSDEGVCTPLASHSGLYKV